MTHGKKSKTVSLGLKSLVQEDRDLMKEVVGGRTIKCHHLEA